LRISCRNTELYPKFKIWALPFRRCPSGAAHPALPIRRCPSGAAHPALPFRRYPSGATLPALPPPARPSYHPAAQRGGNKKVWIYFIVTKIFLFLHFDNMQYFYSITSFIRK
jgi:hypothetical protein